MSISTQGKTNDFAKTWEYLDLEEWSKLRS